MILYRPVGLQELALIYDSDMKAFPARLPQQPIFYPVLHLEYARQVASDWNTKSGQFAGYVTQFKVEDQYINQFEKHTVGESQHEEFWIPDEELDEFNQHIIGHIKVLAAYFGDGFQGFIPETFGLGGKNAVEQFTLLANSFIYNRMDFYLEIKRNHKAVFLNYPFWQTYNFKNPGLKEKILKAIKEAWLTSFPKNPLVSSVAEDTTRVQPLDSDSSVDSMDEEDTPVESTNAQDAVEPVREKVVPVKRINAPTLLNPPREDVTPVKRTDAPLLANPVQQNVMSGKPTESHFVQGVKLGLGGNDQEAIAELSKAVEQNPKDVVALTSLGAAFHRSGQDDRALSCYDAALKINPKYAEAHYFRANILYKRGNDREAIAGYTMAIGLQPELIEAHQKSIPQDRLTDYTSSPAEMYWIAKSAQRILDLTKSLEANPKQANLLKERAAEYARLWNYEQSIADYSSALAIQPDDADALHFRGVAYEQIQQFDRAQEDYRQASSINPQLSNTYLNRGVTFGQMGNLRQSIDSLTESIRLAPKNANGYFNRGTSYFQLGHFERAIDDFSSVIQLAPSDEDAYYWRGISNDEAGHQDEAIADYRQFLAISQNSQAREEIEQRLGQWNEVQRDSATDRSVVADDSQKTNQVTSPKPDRNLDLYGLMVALGERALDSIWLGSGVNCYGEKADELYAYTKQDLPIEGRDLIQIASGIRQTIEGDFQAFDPGVSSPWLFIRAWNGNGFYIETNDRKSKQRLKSQFESIEEVEGASPPYESLFLRV